MNGTLTKEYGGDVSAIEVAVLPKNEWHFDREVTFSEATYLSQSYLKMNGTLTLVVDLDQADKVAVLPKNEWHFDWHKNYQTTRNYTVAVLPKNEWHFDLPKNHWCARRYVAVLPKNEWHFDIHSAFPSAMLSVAVLPKNEWHFDRNSRKYYYSAVGSQSYLKMNGTLTGIFYKPLVIN